MKRKSGITLIALVVTIIVLLILAGVSINMITGDDGIIERASHASEKTEDSTLKESEELKETGDYIEEFVNLTNSVDVTGSIGDYLIVNPCTHDTVKDLFGNVGYGTFVENKGYYPVTVLASELNSPVVSFYAKEEGGEFKQVSFYLWSNHAIYGEAVTTKTLGGSYTNFVLELDPNKSYTIQAQFEESDGNVKYCTYKTNLVTFSYKDGNGMNTTKILPVISGTAVDNFVPSTYTNGSYTYTFNKWVTTSGGTTTANLNEITSNITVYAHYNQQMNESICFVAGTKV